MPRLKSCPQCGGERLVDLRVPCPACGHQRTGQRGSTRRDRRRRARAITTAAAAPGGLRCARCDRPLTGGRDTHYDHVIPKSAGGRDHSSNRQLLCDDCNLEKGSAA